jgi:hypothetical protein
MYSREAIILTILVITGTNCSQETNKLLNAAISKESPDMFWPSARTGRQGESLDGIGDDIQEQRPTLLTILAATGKYPNKYKVIAPLITIPLITIPLITIPLITIPLITIPLITIPNALPIVRFLAEVLSKMYTF